MSNRSVEKSWTIIRNEMYSRLIKRTSSSIRNKAGQQMGRVLDESIRYELDPQIRQQTEFFVSLN
uniref:Uncharacterized protein n=1 Tax=viral metagenome TaxID=1070528 RepID=A0A6M3JIQ1_9ZZZZ